MSRWFAHALLLGVSVGAFAQTRNPQAESNDRHPPESRPNIAGLLNSRIPEVSIGDSALEQVVDWLQDYTGANIVVRWQILADAGVPRDKPISMGVRNLRLSQVLWMIMNEAGGPDVKLAYRASGNLIVLSTADDLGREMLVRVYDVADLLARFPRFRDSPRVEVQNVGQNGGGGVLNTSASEDAADPQPANSVPGQMDPDLQRLIDMIQRTIQPDSWSANFGIGTITAWRTQLIVRNSILVHQELGGPLRDAD